MRGVLHGIWLIVITMTIMIGTYHIGRDSRSFGELLYFATVFGIIVGLIYLGGVDIMERGYSKKRRKDD